MKNNTAATIIALCFALYGVAGFWANLGNETISSALFASIIAALILAPLAIIFSTYRQTKEMQKKSIVKAGVICLAAAAVSLLAFAAWLSVSNRIEIGKLCTVISGVLLACGAAAIIYAASFLTLAAAKKQAP